MRRGWCTGKAMRASGGQSGGATAVGALLTLGRDDVVCAAASSGGFDALARAQDQANQRGIHWNGCDAHGVCGPYNVTDQVAGWCNAGYATERIASLVRSNALGIHAVQPSKEPAKPPQVPVFESR